MLFIICDASDEVWWKLMTREALYYAFYHVTVCYTPAIKQNLVFIYTRPAVIQGNTVRS